MAFGNIIGSSIANILLILGICAMIRPVRISRSTQWKETPYSFLAALIPFVFAFFFNKMVFIEGVVLVFLFALYLVYNYRLAQKGRVAVEEPKNKSLTYSKISFLIIASLFMLYLGGKWTVTGATAFARLIGMSEYFISLTIVAVGTSLPELVTSTVAVFRKEYDIAVGNIVGSNIFNILFILGTSMLINDLALPTHAITDFVVLLAATCFLWIFPFVGRKNHLKKWQGVLFLLFYVSYVYTLWLRG